MAEPVKINVGEKTCKNRVGTSARQSSPKYYRTWIDLWRTFTKHPQKKLTCQRRGCSNKESNRQICGAHVIIDGIKGEWIVPLCNKCNSRKNEMKLNASAEAVRADKYLRR